MENAQPKCDNYIETYPKFKVIKTYKVFRFVKSLK